MSSLVKRNKVNICTLDFYDGNYHTSNFSWDHESERGTMQLSGGKLFQAKAQRRPQGGNRCGVLEEAQEVLEESVWLKWHEEEGEW